MFLYGKYGIVAGTFLGLLLTICMKFHLVESRVELHILFTKHGYSEQQIISRSLSCSNTILQVGTLLI